MYLRTPSTRSRPCKRSLSEFWYKYLEKRCVHFSPLWRGSHLEKWPILGKMAHTWKNGSNLHNRSLEKMGHSPRKYGSSLGQWVTLDKMRHTWKNGSHLEKWVTRRKMRHTWKNVSHLEKWVTLGKIVHTVNWVTCKMCHIWKNGSLQKMGHNCKKVSHLEKGHKNGNHLQKWITLWKIGHLEKWVPLGIRSQTVK